MRIHIVGIAGTFMAGLALIARQLGYHVTGCDQQIYPPMSDVLEQAGIEVTLGYSTSQLSRQDDWIIIGNAYFRGHPYIEAILNGGYRYCSGPEWLAEYVLPHQHVLAVSGTHGKTTTSCMLAWILESAGLSPSFLIGGAPANFTSPARFTASKHFVIEADEYDTAFFDKRSKFLHYRPMTCVINNLEFDHADIFDDLAAIQKQFHYLIRSVPGQGHLVVPHDCEAINAVLQRGCWSTVTRVGGQTDWQVQDVAADGSEFSLFFQSHCLGRVHWSQIGVHNVFNALSACAAAVHAGVSLEALVPALCSFAGVSRRMEHVLTNQGLTVFDDFAHHPTAIASTLRSLRAKAGVKPITVFLECGSRTMQQGIHRQALIEALSLADQVLVLNHHKMDWSLDELVTASAVPVSGYKSVSALLEGWQPDLNVQQYAVLMSNKGFGGLKQELLQRYKATDVI